MTRRIQKRYSPGLFPVLLLGILGSASGVQASEVRLSVGEGPVDVTSSCRVLPDDERRHRFPAVVVQGDGWLDPRPLAEVPRAAAYWFELRLHNATADREQWILKIADPFFQEAVLYASPGSPDGPTRIDRTATPAAASVTESYNAFRLVLAPGQTRTFYLFYASRERLAPPLQIWGAFRYLRAERYKHLAIGVLAGVVLLFSLYNGFLAVSLHDRSYLLYVAYILSSFFAVLTSADLGAGYLGLVALWSRFAVLMVFVASLLSFGALFSRSFLETKRFAPAAGRYLYGVAAAAGSCVVLIALGALDLVNILLALVALLLFAGVLTSGVLCYARGQRSSRFFLVAWMGVGSAIFLISFRETTGVELVTLPSAELMGLGIVWEAVFLSIALADRFRAVREHRRQAEEEANRQRIELLELEKKLYHARKLETIGTMAGGIAHNLNNTLTPILAYADLLRNKLPPTSPHRPYLDKIVKATEQAKDTVRQILAFSHNAEPVEGTLSLADVIDDAVGLIRGHLPENVTLEVRKEPVQDLVKGDATELCQVILNLLKNGIDAMEPAGGRLRIGMGPVPERDGGSEELLHLSVSDDGTGMDEELQSRVFEPFFTTKEVGKGTGLGLPVAQGVVVAYGGRLRLQSAPGQGTTVHLYLPTATPSEVIILPPAPPESYGRERLLVVDDEPEVREMLAATLPELGYKAEICAGGDEALERLRADSQAYDVLITDLKMPGMSGLELIEEVRKFDAVIPVLVLTGNPQDLGRRESRRLGIGACLVKPVTVKEIGAAIQRAVHDTAGALAGLRS